MSSTKPIISVIMSVYNSADTLGKAVESILSQSFEHFELIIVDDGSKDESFSLLQNYAQNDQRIRLLQHQGGVNRGLTKSLNYAIAQARGKYIARQDADDESLPQRFQQQFNYLESHPDVILLGTNQYEVFAEEQIIGKYIPAEKMHRVLVSTNPFAHTSVMLRREVFEKAGAYDETFLTSQDYEAWMRLSKSGNIAMLEEPLVKRYVHSGAISSRKKYRQIKDAFRARKRHFGLLSALKPTTYQLIIAMMPSWLKSLLVRLRKNRQ